MELLDSDDRVRSEGGFRRAVNILLTEKDELMDNAQTIISFLCDRADLEQRQTDLFYCLGRGRSDTLKLY